LQVLAVAVTGRRSL